MRDLAATVWGQPVPLSTRSGIRLACGAQALGPGASNDCGAGLRGGLLHRQSRLAATDRCCLRSSVVLMSAVLGYLLNRVF